jgi:hypothetical protein
MTVMELTASKPNFDGTASTLIAPDDAYGRASGAILYVLFLLRFEHHRSYRGEEYLENHVGRASPGLLFLTGLIVGQRSICRRDRPPFAL